MNRTKALFVAALTIVASACAQPDRPDNGRGGVDFTPEEVLAGAELGPLDSCDACCEPEHYLPWCEEGEGSGNGGVAGGPGNWGPGHPPVPPQPCQNVCYYTGFDWVCYEYCPGNGGEGHWP